MKRMMAGLLAALMLLGGTALAEWPEGTSPSKPYDDLPEVDLNEKMGYMLFYPSAELPALTACQRLYIYLPRDDVKAGEGLLYLCTDAQREIWSTAMNSEAVTQRALHAQELSDLMWGGGTCFEVLLPYSLTLGETYYVNMARGAIVTDKGVESAQMGSTSAWRFTLEGEYGVSNMSYRRAKESGGWEEDLTDIAPGDEIRFDLVLGGEAARAVIYGYGGTVDFLTLMCTESGEVTGTVTSEQPAWGVMFLDAQGNELSRVDFWQ